MTRWVVLWVLGFLLLFGNLARAADKADPVAGYKTFLAFLPKDDPASITKAIDQYRAVIVPLDMDKHVKAFLDFLEFHDSVCDTLTERFLAELDRHGGAWTENGIRAKEWDFEEAQQLFRYGLEVAGDAYFGGYYVAGIPEYIPDTLAQYLPKSVTKYLELRRAEIREGFSVDASLTISYARLAERIAQWDQYLKDFPESLFRTDALILRAYSLRFLLFGVNNSQLDPRTEDRKNNIRVVYEQYMREHPGTYAETLIRKQYDYLKKQGFFNDLSVEGANKLPSLRYEEFKGELERIVKLGYYWSPPGSTYRVSTHIPPDPNLK